MGLGESTTLEEFFVMYSVLCICFVLIGKLFFHVIRREDTAQYQVVKRGNFYFAQRQVCYPVFNSYEWNDIGRGCPTKEEAIRRIEWCKNEQLPDEVVWSDSGSDCDD